MSLGMMVPKVPYFVILCACLLEFGFGSSGLVAHATLPALGASMASQLDGKSIWLCEDFQNRLDKLCSTIAEKKGRLIVITDFDRFRLLLFAEIYSKCSLSVSIVAGRCPRISAQTASPATNVMISCFGIAVPTTIGRKKSIIYGQKQRSISRGKSPFKITNASLIFDPIGVCALTG
jgi:hypothetical protein